MEDTDRLLREDQQQDARSAAHNQCPPCRRTLHPPRCLSTPQCFGLLVVVALTVLNLANTIISYSLLNTDKVNDLILIYFNVSFDTIGFLLARWIKTRSSTTANNATDPTPKRTKYIGLGMMLLFQVGNWLYFKGIASTGVSISTILYQSSTIFVLFFSLLFMKEKVTPLSVLSVLLCGSGVVLVAFDNWHNQTTSQTVGVVALLASAVLWALYEVFLGVVFPRSNQYTVSMYVGWRGGWNFILMWPFVVVVAVLHPTALYDLLHLSAGGKMKLGSMACISVLTTILLTCGISWTSPVYMRLGATLISPASIAWDVYTGSVPGWKCFVGSGLTVLGFCVINMNWERENGVLLCGGGGGGGTGRMKCSYTSTGVCTPGWMRPPMSLVDQHEEGEGETMETENGVRSLSTTVPSSSSA